MSPLLSGPRLALLNPPKDNPLLFLWKGSGSLAFVDRASGGRESNTLSATGAVRWQAASGARTNLILNPRLATAQTNWTNSGTATISRITNDGVAGSTSVEASSSTSGAGLTVLNNAYIRTSALHVLSFEYKWISGGVDWNVFASLGTAAGAGISLPAGQDISIVADGQWHRVAFVFDPSVAVGVHRITPRILRKSATASVVRFTDFVLEELASASPVPSYFDGSTGAWLDPITGQLGAAHASPSVSQAVGWIEEGTTNLLLNPSAEVNATTGVSALAGATITRDTGNGSVGVACFKVVTPNVAGAEGIALLSGTALGVTTARPYPGMVRLRGSGTVKVEVQVIYTDATSNFSAATNITLTDAWQEVKNVVATATGTKTVNYVALIVRTVTQQAATFYVDAGQVEDNKTYSTSYADGSLGTGYAWSSTAHGSASTRSAARLRYDYAETLGLSATRMSVFGRFQRLMDIGSNQIVLDIGGGASSARTTLRVDATDRLEATLLDATGTSGTVEQVTPTAGVATWHSAYLESNGGANAIALDAATKTVGTNPTAGAYLNAPLAIGALTSSTQQLNGLIGPVAIFSRPLTTRERTKLNSLRPEQWHWRMLDAA